LIGAWLCYGDVPECVTVLRQEQNSGQGVVVSIRFLRGIFIAIWRPR